MNRFLHILVAAMLLFSSTTASALDYYDQPVFEAGEHAVFNIYYNWGFVWIHAGDCHFKVQNKKLNGKPSLALLVAGVSTPTFDKMYCIRDSFEAFLNPSTMLPTYYREGKHEDSYVSHTRYFYFEHPNNQEVLMKRQRKTKYTEKRMTIDKSTFDLITSCYHFRNINTSDLKMNEVIPFNMMFDDDIYHLGLTFKGRTIVTLKNGKRYHALKFMPTLITGDLFKDKDDMTVYVSDDMNHVPLMVEAKIKVGYVKAMLGGVTHTKYPMTSYIPAKTK